MWKLSANLQKSSLATKDQENFLKNIFFEFGAAELKISKIRDSRFLERSILRHLAF